MILRIWFRANDVLVREAITERFPYRTSDQLLGIIRQNEEHAVVLLRTSTFLAMEQYKWLWLGYDAGLITYKMSVLEWGPKEWEKRALENTRQEEDAA